jgi:hypothetical protein
MERSMEDDKYDWEWTMNLQGTPINILFLRVTNLLGQNDTHHG